MFRMEKATFTSTKVMSLWSPSARYYAALLAAEGVPFALYMRGVCVIMGKGESRRFSDSVANITGANYHHPLNTVLPIEKLAHYLDCTKIAPALRPLLSNPTQFSSRLGSLCAVRLPLLENATRSVPPALISRWDDGTPTLQAWDVNGHEGMHLLVKELLVQGVQFPASSPMHLSGQPEIVDQMEGVAFCRSHGIPLFLTDTKDAGILKGNYATLSFNAQGVKLLNEGNIGVNVFNALLPQPIEHWGVASARLPQLTFSNALLHELTPCAIRKAILLKMQGWSESAIRHC